jgi:hypothetical protein
VIKKIEVSQRDRTVSISKLVHHIIHIVKAPHTTWKLKSSAKASELDHMTFHHKRELNKAPL